MFNSKTLVRVVCTIASVGVVAACSEDKKNEAQQKIAQTTHSQEECPNIAEGHYSMKNGDRPNFVEISRDDQNKLVVAFNGKDELVANGEKQTLSDGANFTVSCDNSSVFVIGQDTANNNVDLKLYGTETGVAVKMQEPYEETLQYEKSTVVEEAVDEGAQALEDAGDTIKRWFSRKPVPQDESGIPEQDEVQPQGESQVPLNPRGAQPSNQEQ